MLLLVQVLQQAQEMERAKLLVQLINTIEDTEDLNIYGHISFP